MESLGKEFDLDDNRVNQGLTVYGNKGSTDQHAYIQLYTIFSRLSLKCYVIGPLAMIGRLNQVLREVTTCLECFRLALYANDRESITVTVQEVTPRSVGALLSLYERAVGIYASLVNINAYHQPAGKKAAGEVWLSRNGFWQC